MRLRHVLAILVVLVSARASAEEHYALVIAGASGGGEFAEQQEKWRSDTTRLLRERFKFPADHVITLAEKARGPIPAATKENVITVLTELRRRMQAGDLLIVVLYGHGSFDGVDAKFNLVGPDLEAGEWKTLLAPLPGRVVFVNTASASFPFVARLAGSSRIVIAATDSEAQKYQTVFPVFFASAFEDEESDLDKDGRVSLWEAFMLASTKVKRWYEQRGQLATEHAVLDDTGDGVGKQAGDAGPDGRVASLVFLDVEAGTMRSTDPELADLIGRRNLLEGELEELKRKRQFMPPGDYDRELERIVVAIARISRQIRSRS